VLVCVHVPGQLPRDVHPNAGRAGLAGGHVRRVRHAGFSINTLTMLAVVLAVGIVVDDAIVVVERWNTISGTG